MINSRRSYLEYCLPVRTEKSKVTSQRIAVSADGYYGSPLPVHLGMRKVPGAYVYVSDGIQTGQGPTRVDALAAFGYCLSDNIENIKLRKLYADGALIFDSDRGTNTNKFTYSIQKCTFPSAASSIFKRPNVPASFKFLVSLDELPRFPGMLVLAIRNFDVTSYAGGNMPKLEAVFTDILVDDPDHRLRPLKDTDYLVPNSVSYDARRGDLYGITGTRLRKIKMTTAVGEVASRDISGEIAALGLTGNIVTNTIEAHQNGDFLAVAVGSGNNKAIVTIQKSSLKPLASFGSGTGSAITPSSTEGGLIESFHFVKVENRNFLITRGFFDGFVLYEIAANGSIIFVEYYSDIGPVNSVTSGHFSYLDSRGKTIQSRYPKVCTVTDTQISAFILVPGRSLSSLVLSVTNSLSASEKMEAVKFDDLRNQVIIMIKDSSGSDKIEAYPFLPGKTTPDVANPVWTQSLEVFFQGNITQKSFSAANIADDTMGILTGTNTFSIIDLDKGSKTDKALGNTSTNLATEATEFFSIPAGSVWDGSNQSFILARLNTSQPPAVLFVERRTKLSDYEFPLSELIIALAKRQGYASGDIELQGFTNVFIRGWYSVNRLTVVEELRQLASIFDISIYESDGKFKARRNDFTDNITPDFVIGTDDLLTIDGGDISGIDIARSAQLSVTRDDDIPRTVEIQYLDSDTNFEPNVQRANRNFFIQSPATERNNTKQVQTALVLDANQARNAAFLHLYSIWAGQYRFTFRLPRKFFAIEPGDVVSLNVEGFHDILQGSVVRVLTTEKHADLSVSVVAKSIASDNVYDLLDDNYTGVVEDEFFIGLQDTDPLYLDLPTNDSIVVAPKGIVYPGWAGGIVSRKTQEDVDIVDQGSVVLTDALDVGVITSINNLVDGVYYLNESIEVLVESGNANNFTWTTPATITEGVTLAVGNNNKGWKWAIATSSTNTADTATLTGIAIGLNGSSYLFSDFIEVGDFVVVWNPSGVVDLPQLALGSSLDVYGRGFGQTQDEANLFSTTVENIYNRAIPPTDPVLSSGTFGSSDLVIDFKPIAAEPFPFQDNESTGFVFSNNRLYVIEVFANKANAIAGTNVVRTFPNLISTETLTYTVAEHTADFATAPTKIYMRINGRVVRIRV